MKAKYLVLAIPAFLLISLAMSGTASAAETTVTFDSNNPNITVISRFDGAHGLEKGMSVFALNGSSHATGCITALASPTGRSWGSAEISGWFDAEDGDFDSFFGSMMTEAGSPKNWHVTQEGYNEHSLSATGVTNLHVEGGALSTSYNNVESPSAGQSFVGTADSVDALGIGFLEWDSDYDGSLDSSYGASVELSGDGAEPISFDGWTESNRSLYPPWLAAHHPDEGSLNYGLRSWDADSLIANLFTNYSHIETNMTPFEVWGETST